MFGRTMIGIIAVSAALFTAGCGSDDSTPTTTTTPTPTTTTTTTAAATTTTTTPASAPAQAPAGVPVPASEVPHHGAVPPAPVTTPAAGPVGADGSTGNNLTAEYCAQNEDPGCPAGSFVGPNAIPNPDGSGNYVPCEGTICTNPDHGAGTDPQENGGAVMENPNGDGEAVPCEGTICTNPNNGAGE
ncbi:hypothetical protein ACFWPA_03120 [Rhodococcus sp. NPDC058505]|uniref:hypothetical protein n=1 Tax=Rhodococcus sp. NPDC058505 TaxID=3346531 RepID=UPI00364EB1C0